MITYIILLILFIVYLVFLWIKRPKIERSKIEYTLACAGVVGSSNKNSTISLYKNIYNANIKVDGQSINAKDYGVYVADGNSMSIANINNGDFVLVKDLVGNEKDNLASDNILLLDIDRDNDLENKIKYKLRQIITYLNSKENFDNWFDDNFKSNQHIDLFQLKENIRKKYNDCFAKYNWNDNESITLLFSKTYNGKSVEYSFHPINLLRGVVKYVVSSKKIAG